MYLCKGERRAKYGMSLASGNRRCAGILAGVCLLTVAGGVPATAQLLRFSNHREVQIPKYAVLRIGPFYSSARFSLTAGYMYTDTSGTGRDFIFRNRRGEVLDDGSELPVIATLQFRNYLLITRRMDVDMSARLSYEYYPLDTREDGFYVDLVEEGVLANISSEMMFSPYLKGTLYDWFVYRADYIDTRGLEDRYGGRRYEYARNKIGFDLDWLLAKDKNVGLSVSRFDEWSFTDEFDDQERTVYEESALYEQEIMPMLALGAKARFQQIDYEADDRNDGEIREYLVYGRFEGGDQEGLQVRVTDVTTLTVGIGYAVAYSRQRGERTDVESDVTTEREGSDENGVITGFASLETGLRKDLSHKIEARRTVRSSFDSAYDIVDSIDYRIGWQGPLSAATFYTTYREVEPSSERVSRYSDWTTGFDLRFPLMRYVDFYLQSMYSIRDNKDSDETDDALDQTERFDYETWVTRAGTQFRVSKNVSFDFYYQHTERYSDSEDLQYSRDLLAALFTYSHEF